jgi:hypothetical protein
VKPRRKSDSSFSSIPIEPWPCGLSLATLQKTGCIPSGVSATINSVAKGEKAPTASAAIAGMWDSEEKCPRRSGT